MCPFRNTFPEQLALFGERLRLLAQELTLELEEFLWFPDIDSPMRKIHGVRERFRCHRDRSLSYLGGLLIEIISGFTHSTDEAIEYRPGLIETLLGELTYPVHS